MKTPERLILLITAFVFLFLFVMDFQEQSYAIAVLDGLFFLISFFLVVQ